MSKRILVISYYYAPQNTIGAIRPTKLVKYLERMGHQVTVLCGGGLDAKVDPTLRRDLEQMKDVRILREWNPIRERDLKRVAAQAQPTAAAAPAVGGQPPRAGAVSRIKKLLAPAIDQLYLYMAWLADRHFGRLCKKEIRKLEGQYDCVLSSYSTFSVHEAAAYAKRTGKAKKWIADFRDEVNMFFPWQKGRQERYTRMVRRQADLITAVSPGVLEMMGMEKEGRVLTNGFDREDLPAAEAAQQPGLLRIAYCGYISEGRKGGQDRDLSPLMHSMRQLIDEGAIAPEELRLVYAGSQSGVYQAVAAAAGLEACVEDHGLVSRQESISLQRSADVLLMASWHMTGRKGILTGKLFEYMMMDKPVICCMAGDLTGSDVKGVLEKTGIGFCCEQAAGEADRQALTAYLRQILARKREGLPTLEAGQRQALEEYAYPTLAAKMSCWIEE